MCNTLLDLSIHKLISRSIPGYSVHEDRFVLLLRDSSEWNENSGLKDDGGSISHDSRTSRTASLVGQYAVLALY